MKRYVRSSSEGKIIYDKLIKAADKLSCPQKFHSSKISIEGVYGQQVALSISCDHLGYKAVLDLGDGARYVETASDFESAKRAFNEIARKYVTYAYRFKGEKLSDEDYRTLTNGL